VHILYDPSGRASGEGYVELATEDALKQALTFDKKNMGTRYVELFKSNVEELTAAIRAAQSAPTRRTSRSLFGGYRDERDRWMDRSERDRDRRDRRRDRRRRDDDYRGGSEDDNCTVLKMLGIPFQASEQDITKFFQEANAQPVRIHRKQNGGEAFIEFNSPRDVNRGMTLNKRHIGRRYVDLYPITYEEMASIIGISPNPPPRFSGGGGGGGGYDRSGGRGSSRMGGGPRGGGGPGEGFGGPQGTPYVDTPSDIQSSYGPPPNSNYLPNNGGPPSYGPINGGQGVGGPPGGYNPSAGGYGTNYGGGSINNFGPRGY